VIQDAGVTACHPQIFVPTLDEAKNMSCTVLFDNLLGSLIGTVVCHQAAKIYVLEAKRRMQNGQPVGGCLTFKGKGGLVDLHFRREGQTLEAACRAAYRLLGGLGILDKYDSSATKKKNAEKKVERQKAKDKAAEEKAASEKLEADAEKLKSLKRKDHIEVLEQEIENLKRRPSAEADTKPPVPVKIEERNPVNADVAATDARDLDTSILILQKIVFAVDDKRRQTAIKAAIKFLKYKNAFVETSEEAL
jgi:hypothetical protein